MQISGREEEGRKDRPSWEPRNGGVRDKWGKQKKEVSQRRKRKKKVQACMNGGTRGPPKRKKLAHPHIQSPGRP